ncbi:MAG: hypothetical protein KIS30_04090 [Thermoplasmata archaeon]|nr:hypothetical protein [Candidatus Sysuiplasma acidicola]MBX8645925.1 hypothetical protein [Candidatus Sysuiplasma acidicola]
MDARNNVYNDIDLRLVNLLNVIRECPYEFRQRFETFVYSRELFEKYVHTPETGEPVDDVFTTFFVFYSSFAGKGWTFGYLVGNRRSISLKVLDAVARVEEVSREIQSWTI